MNLRTKTMVLVLAALVVGFAVLAPLDWLILRSFRQIEAQTTEQHLAQALNALADDRATLQRTAHDYAMWDDTYSYMAEPAPEFITSNFPLDTFVNNRLSLVALLAPDGTLRWGAAADAELAATAPVTALLGLDTLQSLVLRGTAPISGVVAGAQGPILIAVEPILTSAGEGPSAGRLVMGRQLDGPALAQLAATTRLDLALLSAAAVELGPRQTQLATGQPVLTTLDSGTIIAERLLRDLDGAPLMVLRVTGARTIWAQGRAAVQLFTLVLALGALGGGWLLVVALDRFLVRRITLVYQTVAAVERDRDPAVRVPALGGDEIGQLAAGLNGMLAALALAQSTQRAAEGDQARLQAELITAQSQLLAELSAPLLPISAQLVVLPLIGTLSPERLQGARATLLAGLVAQRARAVIIDLTGVASVDAPTAAALAQTVQAAQLVGALVVLSGLQPAVALQLVQLRAVLGATAVCATLAAAVTLASAELTAPDRR